MVFNILMDKLIKALEEKAQLEVENQYLREMLKEAFESLDALLVCFENNVKPGFLVKIDNFFTKKGRRSW